MSQAWVAGFHDREIAHILGWKVDRVADMRRIYINQDDIIADQIKRLSASLSKPK